VSSIKIVDGSIILSYSFIYDEESVPTGGDLPKVENLLSYADRVFEKNRIYKYENLKDNYFEDIVLRVEGRKFETFKLRVEDVNILFFQDNIAILYIKITPSTKDLKSLYKINRALTQFYTKQKSNDAFIYFGKEKFEDIKISLQQFQEHLGEFLQNEKIKNANRQLCEDMLKATKNVVSTYQEVFKHKSLQLATYLSKEREEMIKIELLEINEFTQMLLDTYYPTYTPYISQDKKEYPLSGEKIDDFSGRVGIVEEEREALEKQESQRHYLYFENQLKLVNKSAKEGKYEFVHYDTFITSFILKYVAVNSRLKYYDNFNPLSTSYINSYITLVCEGIEDEYENNFISFEPLVNSKASKGKKITNSDFFNTYQSQADMFTIGNSHSIVHILDKNVENLKNNKETTHFYTYLLTTTQRNFILNIISTSIVNINNIGDQKVSLKDTIHNFQQLTKTLDKYNTFLTNYNFKIISNSSSVDNSYNFFRKCNEVDKLTSQWSAISFKMKDWKSILSHILHKKPLYLFGIMMIALALLNVFNHIINDLFNLLPSLSEIYHML
jgi:hypothetical protein